MGTAGESRGFVAAALSVLIIASAAIAQYSSDSATAAHAKTSTYQFLADKSTITQSGGIAGIQRTYTIAGTFDLKIDVEAGTASFDRVDANAVDDSPYQLVLDPNEVFNMTGLAGVIMDATTIRFEGKADNETSVLITLTFSDDTVTLKGRTTPPPNSADFFIFSIDAVAQRKYSGGTGDPNSPYQIATADAADPGVISFSTGYSLFDIRYSNGPCSSWRIIKSQSPRPVKQIDGYPIFDALSLTSNRPLRPKLDCHCNK